VGSSQGFAGGCLLVNRNLLMATLAGLKILLMMAGIVAIAYVLGFDNRCLVLQRNFVRNKVTFSALGNILAVVWKIPVRIDGSIVYRFEGGRSFDKLIEWAMTGQAIRFSVF
jgi:hypothetical protein